MKNKKLLNKLRLMAPPKPADYRAAFPPEKPKAPTFPADLAEYHEGYTNSRNYRKLEQYLLHTPGILWAVKSFGPDNKAELLVQARQYDMDVAVYGHNYSRWSAKETIYHHAHWANFWATTMLEQWQEMDFLASLKDEEDEQEEETGPGQKYMEAAPATQDAPALLVTTVEVLPLAPADVIEKRTGADHPNYPFQDDKAEKKASNSRAAARAMARGMKEQDEARADKIKAIADAIDADERKHGNRAWE